MGLNSPPVPPFQECGYVPGLVTWLRYSGFIVLYPTGAWAAARGG